MLKVAICASQGFLILSCFRSGFFFCWKSHLIFWNKDSVIFIGLHSGVKVECGRAVSVSLKDMVDTLSQINYYFFLCSLMDWSQGSQRRNYFLSWCKLLAVRFALIISKHVRRALEWQASITFPLNVIAFWLETPVIQLISNDITNKLVVLRGFISLTLFNVSIFS